MERLVKDATKKTPGVDFDINGKFNMQGRILEEDPIGFFDPIIEWVEKVDFEDIEFTIDLDYLNTSASKMLFTILRILDDNTNIDNIKVNWYYEEDDEDHLEIGEYFNDSLSRCEFEFFMVSESSMAA